MFAVLQKTMESSPVYRPSLTTSPTLLPPPIETPSLSIPWVKAEKAEDRESPFKNQDLENYGKSFKDHRNTDKFEPKVDRSDCQILKQKLEMYWKGMMKYREELQQEPGSDMPGVMENVSENTQMETESTSAPHIPWQNVAALAGYQRSSSLEAGQNKQISNYSPITNESVTMQQASLLSQQALAAMLSLQKIQRLRQPENGTKFGNLLPPPPGLFTPTDLPPTTSSFYPHPVSSTVVTQLTSEKLSSPKHTVSSNHSSTSRVSSSWAKKPQAKSPMPDFDMPLDLSLSAAGRKRAHDGVTKLASNNHDAKHAHHPHPKDRKKVDDVSLASIKSNFPTLLNGNRAQSRAAQQAMLTAHIENSLSTDSVTAAKGPFTSFYQRQESGVLPASPNFNELIQGVQPLQIQQWLLAAVSAQKMQQMALSHISMLQQQHQQAANYSDRPKKHSKLNDHPMRSYASHQPKSSIAQQQPLFPQPLNRGTPDSHHQTPSRPNHFSSSNRSSPKPSSPTHSPDSNQSQSGKRYRRYAKPPYSYVSLITLSILSSRVKKLRLSQILKRISEMFPFFNGSYQGWRDSVRHNLSQNECFVKVLKNPYRPTAKGNFWTVNLNSIPHELLLRQNTLVSRYAQDSGYRYRKDLSEVFDLRTGALKVPVPRHLLRDTNDPNVSALSDDPAALIEAVLLEETCDDERNDYIDKIAPDVRQFNLEDLFNQNEECDDDSLLSSGRNRTRNKAASRTLSHHASLLPRSFAPPLYPPTNPPISIGHGIPTSFHNRAVEAQNFAAMGMLPQVLLSQSASQTAHLPLALSTAAPNPFAAAQTALLSKALAATQLQTFDGLQKILYANQALQKPSFDGRTALSSGAPVKTLTPPILTSVSPIPKRATPSPFVAAQRDQEDNDQSALSDASSSSKKNRRKGVHPVRHAGNTDVPAHRNGIENGHASPKNSFHVPAVSRESSTPSRNLSSEADSASANPFSSSITSSFKSQSSTSPRHDESMKSAYEENRHPPLSILEPEGENGISSFQALQMFGAASLQASKMA